MKVHYVQGTNISKSTVVQYLRELYLLRSNVEKKEMNSLIILLALSQTLVKALREESRDPVRVRLRALSFVSSFLRSFPFLLH